MISFHFFLEIFRFAWHSIISNKLRTFLSLLGVTIGILAVISVFTIIDSLETNVRDSINKLGSDVIYIQKWPWGTNGDSEYKWWDFMSRPEVSINEMKKISSKSTKTQAIAFMNSANRTVKYLNNSVEGVAVMAVSYDWNLIRSFDLENGRYFTEQEVEGAKNYVILGHSIALSLFNKLDNIGKVIKIKGEKAIVIGVFSKEGEDITGNSLDAAVVIPVTFGYKLMNKRWSNPTIIAKAKSDISNDELRYELTGIMRSIRKLRPKTPNNFAMNEISLISNQLDDLFSIIGIAGWIIGGFSILVGGFGIANIMFVSVKERTRQIGVQKSLGAKNNFILYQFLIESVFLCLIGGILGIILVLILTNFIAAFLDFSINLSFKNIFLGLSISTIVGIISGIVPALSASKLDPVEAMRR
ncbi:MAG: ABC transporter [Flavobacteriales bacterium]|nr:ABC transporter [Flavobacteriales bacterium]|tara:strand:+ start:112 stop:1353 length:1242 start_codon:yes stop_codon:yes gene_type:complete